MRKLVIFLFIFATHFGLLAQSSIHGLVTDQDMVPILGADIYIEELHIGTTSDLSGYFELRNIPKGTHKLTIAFIGYATENLSLEIKEDDMELNITLKPSIFHMDEVIVSAPFNKLQSENVMKIEYKSMASLAKTGAPTLMQAITTIPGVAEITAGTGIGKPVIRGLSSNRVLVYTQGVRLENQQFGNEHGLGLNDSGIESVEVIKGPASLLYGSDALGGVLYLNPEKFAYQDETKINISQDFYSNTLGSNTSVGVKTSKKKFKYIVRGGFNSHADYQIPDGDRVTNTRFLEKDFKAGLGMNLDRFVSEFRYNYIKSEIGIPEGIDQQSTSRTVMLPYQDLGTHILSLHNHIFLNRSKIDIDLGYVVNDRKEYEEDHDHEEDHAHEEAAINELEGEAHDDAALDMNLKTFTYNLKYSLPKYGKLETIVGLQGMAQTNKNYGEEILIPDAEINDVGALVTSILDINERHSLQGGLRYDYRTLHADAVEDDHLDNLETHAEREGLDRNFSNASFSFGYRAQFNENITSRINFASGFRAPNLAELTSYGVHHGTNRFEIGNPNLINEQNFQTDLSIEYGNKHLEIYANGFFNKVNNYIFLSPIENEIDGYQVFEYVQSDANLYGGEFGIHYHPHPYDWLHLESGYETVIGKQTNGNYLPLIPANKWSNTIRVEFMGSEKFNEIYAALILATYFEQNNVSQFETATPGYNLLNLRMGGNLSFEKLSIGINFSINNMLNETYISHLSILKADMIPNPGRNVVLGLNFNIL